MAIENPTTAPARDALAAWDTLHNEREVLNGLLDCSNDASFHQPEGRVPAETVRELATAAILLEQANSLLQRVSQRQIPDPREMVNIDGQEYPLDLVCKALDVVMGNNPADAMRARFDDIQARCDKLPMDLVALELRQHNWDACENLSASVEEDGYTVIKTWTRKGLRYFLAQQAFMENLLGDD